MAGFTPITPSIKYLINAPDSLLARRAGNCDEVAFEILARRYGPLMKATAHRLVGSSVDADDVVQVSLIQAWEQLENLRNPSAVKSWILRIVVVRSIDAMRKRRPYLNLEEVSCPEDQSSPYGSGNPEACALRACTVDALRAALECLPEQQRRCWILRELDGLSYQDISLVLSISPASVRGSLARARGSLTEALYDWR